MGEVWLAELEGAGAFRRRVVIKVLAPERRGDPRIASMLADEARVVGLLHHPGIVAAVDYLEAETEGPIFVLEFVDGCSLRSALKVARKRGDMAPEQETGESVTPATDIYALGKVIAEAVGPDCGPGLREVIGKATQERPEDRYQTAAEMAFALGHACPLPRAPEAELAAWVQRAAPEALHHGRATSAAPARRDSQPPPGVAVVR